MESLASIGSRIKYKLNNIFDKFRPFSTRNCSRFEKQLLVCYWDLVGTDERLTRGHQVTMQLELLIMNVT